LLDSQIMIQIIDTMASERNISRHKLLTNCGVRNYVDNLLKGQLPKVDTVAKIADYYNVSVDYLLGRTDNPKITRWNILHIFNF